MLKHIRFNLSRKSQNRNAKKNKDTVRLCEHIIIVIIYWTHFRFRSTFLIENKLLLFLLRRSKLLTQHCCARKLEIHRSSGRWIIRELTIFWDIGIVTLHYITPSHRMPPCPEQSNRFGVWDARPIPQRMLVASNKLKIGKMLFILRYTI